MECVELNRSHDWMCQGQLLLLLLLFIMITVIIITITVLQVRWAGLGPYG